MCGTKVQIERIAAAPYEKMEIAQLLTGGYSCRKVKGWIFTPGNMSRMFSIPDFFN